MRTLGAFLWRYLLGALFTLTPVTAVLVVGWTQRATARAVARRWHAQAGNADKDFAAFARASEETSSLAHWPRWIMADDAGALFAEARRSGPLRAGALVLRALFGSLWANARAGLSALLPIAIVLAPAGLLWLFSWWAGWDNSFNKGYEQAWVGPTVAFAGIAYFIVTMSLLPFAEVRQAINNSWRAFFDVAFLRRAAREARLGLIGLAVAFVTAGFIVASLKVVPLGLGNAAATPEEALRWAQAYPLLVACVLFPLYVALRLVAARVYSRAAARLAVKAGTDAFAARERGLLDRLSLGRGEAPARSGLARLAIGSRSFATGLMASAVVFAVWFGLVSEIYVSQFLVHDWTHWVNHPLVQLPWVGSIFSVPAR
ncbi:MAG: hypothetical protein KBA31_06205 [Alphaproteobacteria bacterium]|nr:hypothetical protein [Alphaproteobacteria bacterium]